MYSTTFALIISYFCIFNWEKIAKGIFLSTCIYPKGLEMFDVQIALVGVWGEEAGDISDQFR